MKNERGIFLVSKPRSILSRIMYNRHFDKINNNMTELNLGARKKMAACDNISIVSAVINEALNDDKDVVVSVFDYKQMFDALDIKKAISGIFDLGIQNKDLCLWYNSNEKVVTTVQTEAGEAKPVTIKGQ